MQEHVPEKKGSHGYELWGSKTPIALLTSGFGGASRRSDWCESPFLKARVRLKNLLHEPSTCSCQSPAWARITAELALTGGPRGLQLPSCRAGPVLLTAPEHDGLAARGSPSLFRARRGREHGPSALLPGLPPGWMGWRRPRTQDDGGAPALRLLRRGTLEQEDRT